jgi:rhodanese-related sulfurtransferase
LCVLVLFVAPVAACSSTDEPREASPTPAAESATTPAQLLEPARYAEFLAQNPDVPVLNVHIPYEGHLEGTDAFVAFDRILEWEGLPADRTAPIALYCRSGNMSRTAAEALAGAGYDNLVDLAGGMNAWSDAGYELLDDEAAAFSVGTTGPDPDGAP